MITAEGIFNI
jgi:hypothetical protein